MGIEHQTGFSPCLLFLPPKIHTAPQRPQEHSHFPFHSLVHLFSTLTAPVGFRRNRHRPEAAETETRLGQAPEVATVLPRAAAAVAVVLSTLAGAAGHAAAHLDLGSGRALGQGSKGSS